MYTFLELVTITEDYSYSGTDVELSIKRDRRSCLAECLPGSVWVYHLIDIASGYLLPFITTVVSRFEHKICSGYSILHPSCGNPLVSEGGQ